MNTVNWVELATQCIAFLIVGAIVYGLSRLLRCKLDFPELKNPKRSALHSLIAACIGVTAVTLICIVVNLLGIQSKGKETGYRVWHLILPMMQLLSFAVPAGFFMIKNSETLESVGVTRKNLWQAIVIALLLVILTFYASSGGFAG